MSSFKSIPFVCGLVLAFGLFQNVWAQCFVDSGYKRAEPSATFRLDQTIKAWLPAIQAAAEAWNNAGSSFRFNKLPDDNSPNIISFQPHPICGTSKNSAACTTISGEGNTITSTEMKFNSDLSWSLMGEAGKYDVQNTATHEFGHWLSLGDIVLSQAFVFDCFEETMYGSESRGETKKRTLATFDIVGIQTIYPKPNVVGEWDASIYYFGRLFFTPRWSLYDDGSFRECEEGFACSFGTWSQQGNEIILTVPGLGMFTGGVSGSGNTMDGEVTNVFFGEGTWNAVRVE